MRWSYVAAMIVGDLVRAMELVAPTRLAATWDNVGLLVGDEASPARRVLLTIDCTPAVVAEAVGGGYDAIVAYHPPIFAATKRFVAGSVAYSLARAGIALYSPHTALDAAAGGTNDVLAAALAMIDPRPLRPASVRPGDPDRGIGFGRVGAIPEGSLADVVGRVKSFLGVGNVLVCGALEGHVARAAVGAGSGGELIGDAVAAGADVLLTGELRHHDALSCCAAGLSVIATLHSRSERCVLPSLEKRLASLVPGLVFGTSEVDRDPFVFA
jgi:dinuclear metal center YbgI/SA1388 family protein